MMNNGILVTDVMKRRSVVNDGSKSRLNSVIKRAARGETITFSVIGGSITHGFHAETRRESYAELAAGWWKERFPWIVVNYINAGIGATDSYIGVHRADRDLLAHSPDVVIVEFSVNDTDPVINSQSYDSLIEKILSSSGSPAVILLFTLQDDGTNMQKIHSEIGKKYDLPMISYADAVWPEIESGNIKWTDISPDNIHPSGTGHRIIAELINSYMDSVFSEAFSSEEPVREYIPKETKYKNAVILDNRSITPDESTGFYKSSVSIQFPAGWSTKVPGKMIFKLEARNIGIMYYRTAETRSGTCNVFVDGTEVSELNGDFAGGWGDYTDYKEVYTSEECISHTIEIKTGDKSEISDFTVIGLCIS